MGDCRILKRFSENISYSDKRINYEFIFRPLWKKLCIGHFKKQHSWIYLISCVSATKSSSLLFVSGLKIIEKAVSLLKFSSLEKKSSNWWDFQLNSTKVEREMIFLIPFTIGLTNSKFIRYIYFLSVSLLFAILLNISVWNPSRTS